MYILGIIAFAFFFLNDINDYKFHISVLKACFPIGACLLIGETIWFAWKGESESCNKLWCMIPIVIMCLFFLAAEIHSLFFSFDSSEAYGKTENNRMVYTKKFYALCRHPGVLFFICLYFLISIITHLPIGFAALLSACNLLLALFEDKIIFPSILGGYGEYKKNTPFLIPNVKSVLKCIGDFRRRV